MTNKLLAVMVALLAVACVPISPEPSTLQSPTPAPANGTAHCSDADDMGFRPGQRADDPVSESIPGYVDIVAVSSVLEGEILTVTLYLRELPEIISTKREGVEAGNVEYSWHIDIAVDPNQSRYDYVLDMKHIAKGGSGPVDRPFSAVFSSGVWEYEEDDGDDLYAFTLLPQLRARHEVQFETNAIVIEGEIPGIRPDSRLRVLTWDMLSGTDQVSCPPKPASVPISEDHARFLEMAVSECDERDYLALLPGQSADDLASESLPEYIDIVGVETSLDGEQLAATFHLRGIPKELEYNRVGVENLHFEYMWTVQIDLDGDLGSGTDDYQLGSHYAAKRVLADSPSSFRPFGVDFMTNVWKYSPADSSGVVEMTLSPGAYAQMRFSTEENSLTLSGRVPGITADSLLLFSTYDILLGQDGVSCPPEKKTAMALNLNWSGCNASTLPYRTRYRSCVIS